MAEWYRPGKIKINPGQNLGPNNDDTVDQLAFDPKFLTNPDAYAGSGPGPEPEHGSPEWPAWKAHAKAWRRSIGQRQADVDMQLSMGASLEDLGIKDVQEEGRAGYRRRARMGDSGMGAGGGWEYDWASGRKRDRATSDQVKREQWVPIDENDRKERATAQQYGGGVQGYTNRLQSEQRSRFGNVMREGGPGNGIKQNEFGIYEDVRPDGSTVYRDEYGATTDKQGNRTGGSYDYDGKGKTVVNRDSNGNATDSVAAPTFGNYSWGANKSYGGAWGGAVQPATPARPAPGAPGSTVPSQYSGNTGSQPQTAIPGYNAPAAPAVGGTGFMAPGSSMSSDRRQAVNSRQYRASIPGLNQSSQQRIPGL